MANDELVDNVVPCGLLVDRQVAIIVLQPSSLGLGGEMPSQRQLAPAAGLCELGQLGWGLLVTGEGVTLHLRGSKDKGRDDGGDPAIAKVKDGEPGNALHGDDVGQEEEEEQVIALKQVHILGSFPQGPEVLGDLGLWSKSTGKVLATWPLQRKLTSSCPEKWVARGADPQACDPMDPGHHVPHRRAAFMAPSWASAALGTAP